MNKREMCPRTLLALADELDRDAKVFDGMDIDSDVAARLRGIAMRYRRRSRLARGGWAAVEAAQRVATDGPVALNHYVATTDPATGERIYKRKVTP